MKQTWKEYHTYVCVFLSEPNSTKNYLNWYKHTENIRLLFLLVVDSDIYWYIHIIQCWTQIFPRILAIYCNRASDRANELIETILYRYLNSDSHPCAIVYATEMAGVFSHLWRKYKHQFDLTKSKIDSRIYSQYIGNTSKYYSSKCFISITNRAWKWIKLHVCLK